ncbi:MAG: DUF4293 domain-containing protein [Clostridium sp.]|nr:DUF4293 domain-containing protein [Prevotella sp.]MCM1428846.1 DUF4293 domain-containing protein [Clostridium sp.]MCM1475221.1 DUF4293 domain-containing protein [Muribaculaceae bacterium]
MVIQRWQSLFLLFSCVLMALFSFLSLGQFQTDDFSLNFTALGIYYEGIPTGDAPTGVMLQTFHLFILSIMSSLLCLVTIFVFKNMKLQRKLCLIDIMFEVATLCLAAYIGYTAVPGYCPGWSSIAFAPFIAIIFSIMAWRFIRRDHNLLRSADRIR